MKRISILVILGLLVWAGFYLRFIDLGLKPMHTDEAVNGVMVCQMLAGEPVAFDPSHYHGPLLRYLALPTVWAGELLFGQGLSETSLRWLTAFAGGLIVLSLFFYRDHLGEDASFVALVFASVSPPLIYYNRYFIHESLFVLFSLLFLVSLWRFLETEKAVYAVITGFLLGLLHAVRETVVLVIVAACVGLILSNRRNCAYLLGWILSKNGRRKLGLLAVCAASVSVLFYSAFFTYWQGVADSFLTYFHYETQKGHEKAWYYYLGLLVGERNPVGYFGQFWLLVFGSAGLWQAFADRKQDIERTPFFRYIAGYTLATTALYSVIAYKTPWLMFNFLVGWILLAGVGWVYLWDRFGSRIVRAVLLLALLVSLSHSLWQSWILSFRYAADPRNPYVYSHTSPDLLKLVDRLEVLSKLDPAGKSMRIDVIGAEYWPLPWYLRDYKAGGYWSEYPLSENVPVRIYSFTADQELPEIDNEFYMTELRGLREGVFLLVCIEKSLWDKQFGPE